MTDQPFKIDMYFNIRYYAKKHSKTITRRAKWDEKCRTWTDKKAPQTKKNSYNYLVKNNYYKGVWNTTRVTEKRNEVK